MVEPSLAGYVKFFYWIPAEFIESALVTVKRELNLDPIPNAYLRECEVLNPNHLAMHVPPAVWSKNCYRQGSWFRTSLLATSHLIVSSRPLNLEKAIKRGKIVLKHVSTPPQVAKNDYLRLLDQQAFRSLAPQEWFHFLKNEVPLFQGFIDRKKLGVNLQEFLEMHSANHANFLVNEDNVLGKADIDGEMVPCSLFSSDFTCSACLELFGVIGKHFPKKLVKNCPGLKAVPLDPAEYFVVELF